MKLTSLEQRAQALRPHIGKTLTIKIDGGKEYPGKKLVDVGTTYIFTASPIDNKLEQVSISAIRGFDYTNSVSFEVTER